MTSWASVLALRSTSNGAGDTVVIRKARGRPTRGQRVAERLRGRGDVAMTTDEIMALTRGA